MDSTLGADAYFSEDVAKCRAFRNQGGPTPNPPGTLTQKTKPFGYIAAIETRVKQRRQTMGQTEAAEARSLEKIVARFPGRKDTLK